MKKLTELTILELKAVYDVLKARHEKTSTYSTRSDLEAKIEKVEEAILSRVNIK